MDNNLTAPNPPDEHDVVAELLPAYALWAVTEAEIALIASHLGHCRLCQAEVVALQRVAQSLPLTVNAPAPSPQLRGRIIAAAEADLKAVQSRSQSAEAIRHAAQPQLTPARAVDPLPLAPPPARQPVSLRGASRRWFEAISHQAAALAATLLLCLALGLGGWNLALQAEVTAQRSSLQSQQTQLKTQQEQLLAQQRQIADLQTDLNNARRQPSAVLLAATGTDAAPTATGQVVYLPQHHTAYINVEHLPALTNSQAYQVWYIQNGRPIDAGLLPTGQDQATTRLQADLSRYEAIAVSREPAGGSRQPTGPIVVQAPIKLGVT